MRILIVDDERQITRVLRTSLQSHGYDVQVAQDGLEAFALFEQSPPNLIITDLSMPNMDGLELTKAVRRIADTPIIVLSVREQEATKIAALDSGADDYVNKPFSMPELMARVRAQLRRTAKDETPAATVSEGDFVIDTDAHRVSVRGAVVHLTPKEFDLLLLFAQNTGRVMTHKALLRAIWGPAGDDQPEYLRVLVAQLRRKIDKSGAESYIQSEPWIGYRFNSQA
jgi:two-component system, OmpR family, KDP operon response regulator KdpE